MGDDPPALQTTSTQHPPAKSPPKTLLPPPPSPRPPQAPPPSPETLLEKQKRLEKEAEMLEQERQKLQQEHTQLKQAAESIRQRQRNLTIALQVDLCSMNSTFNVAPFCPYFYSDSEPVVGFDDRAYEINFTLGLRKEDLSFSISNNALRSEWGNGASVSEGVGNVLPIIGRTAMSTWTKGLHVLCNSTMMQTGTRSEYHPFGWSFKDTCCETLISESPYVVDVANTRASS